MCSMLIVSPQQYVRLIWFQHIFFYFINLKNQEATADEDAEFDEDEEQQQLNENGGGEAQEQYAE